MVKCLECNKEFKQITNRHLKYVHNLTTEEYRKKYPSASLFDDDIISFFKERSKKNNELRKGIPRSKEVKEKIRNTKLLKKTNPWNKGIPQRDETKEKIKQRSLDRIRKWKKEGIHPLKGRKCSENTKKKISESLIKFYSEQVLYKEKLKKFKKISKKFDKLLNYFQNAEKSNVWILSGWNSEFIKCKCKKCGHIFERTIQAFQNSKVRTDLCDACRITPKHSHDEIEIYELIKKYDSEVKLGARNIIFPFELDIFSKKFNLGIEYCGLYWHSELQGKTSDYHLSKLEECKKNGIKLLTIFEDEWKLQKNIVISRILNACNLINEKIYARNCEIKEIDSRTASLFLKRNHLQGVGRSNVRLGLFYKNKLISVMTFLNKDISKKNNNWELNRFCSQTNLNVVGGASKLFNYFIKNYNPEIVVSFSDRRWGEGTFYEKLGFVFDHSSPPSYWYISGIKRIHRFALRKNKNDDPNLSEWENRKLQGWNRIWDCGHNKWIWRK